MVTGNPVRSEVLQGEAEKAVAALGWAGMDRSLPVIYVTGGAQGSAQVNGVVSEILPWLLERANVIHQCGADSEAPLREVAARLPARLSARYLVTGFVGPELPDVLALADVVVSRSGAGTIAELTALGKASVLIPLPTSAGDEQRHNARYLAECGAAVALAGDVTPGTLTAALEPLIADQTYRADVAATARSLGTPDAAERLAEAVLTAAGQHAAASRPQNAEARCFLSTPTGLPLSLGDWRVRGGDGNDGYSVRGCRDTALAAWCGDRGRRAPADCHCRDSAQQRERC